MQNHLEKEAFALELAETLQDTDSLPFYRLCIEWYDEEYLRKTLAKVLSMSGILNRGAYFTKLVSSRAKKPFRPWA